MVLTGKGVQGFTDMLCTLSTRPHSFISVDEPLGVAPMLRKWLKNAGQVGWRAYAMSSSLEKLTWLRCICEYILSPSFKWQYPEKSLQVGPVYKALLITDCKSLYDLVTKLAVPNCEEWRTTVEVMLIKQQSEGHSQCRWISTAIMLADCLTKPMEASFLRTVLKLGRLMKVKLFKITHTVRSRQSGCPCQKLHLKEISNLRMSKRKIDQCECDNLGCTFIASVPALQLPSDLQIALTIWLKATRGKTVRSLAAWGCTNREV